MAQKREHNVQTNLEPPVYRILTTVTREIDVSMSDYIRSLIIKDFRDRGLMSDREINDMVLVC